MAEGEANPLDGATEQILGILLGFYIVITLVTGAVERLEENFGFDPFHPIESYRNITTLGEHTKPPKPVIATNGIDIFSEPGGGRLLGFQPEDAQGTITGGPEMSGSSRFWDVDFQTGPDGWAPERGLESASGLGFFSTLVTVFVVLSIGISFVLFGVAVYVSLRAGQIRAARRKQMDAAMPTEPVRRRNDRWERIIEHTNSTNPNDWRAAIIEADVILDELVTRMGYRGNSLGDKLKAIDRSDFVTIDHAWEAHKTRNRIAHAGSDYILTQREAERIIELYRQVFDEFYYI